MEKPEARVQRELLIAGNRGPRRLFRNNIGKFKIQGTWRSFGIPGPGGSDLLGWTTVEITPDMVGDRIAIFTAIEVKTSTGRVAKKQQAWLDLVERVGGIGKLCRCVEDLQNDPADASKG